MGASKFTQELFDSICHEISYSDKGLVSICRSKDLNANSFYEWIAKDKGLGDKYARARELQAEYLADQILEIADDGSKDEIPLFGEEGEDMGTKTDYENIQRSKLRVDARKWKASKLAPKKYGDKTDITTNGQPITAGKAAIINFDGKSIEILE